MTRRKKQEPPRPAFVLQAAIDEESGEPTKTGAVGWYSGAVPIGIDPTSETAQTLYRAQLRSDWDARIEDQRRAERFEQELAMRSALYAPHSVQEVLVAGFQSDDIRTRERERLERQGEARRAAASQYNENRDVSPMALERSQRARRERLENTPASKADVSDLRSEQMAMSARLEQARVRASQPSFIPS